MSKGRGAVMGAVVGAGVGAAAAAAAIHAAGTVTERVVVLDEENPAVALAEGADLSGASDDAPAEDPKAEREKRNRELGLPEYAELQDDGSVLLPLLFPCKLVLRRTDGTEREQEFKELHMRRLTGAHMLEVMAAGQKRMTVACVARSLRVAEPRAEAMMRAMDGADTAAVAQVALVFITPGRPTGR